MISCPACGGKTSVVETRATNTSVRRRRRCVVETCGNRITTVELIVSDGNAADLASGSVLVPMRQLGKLRKLIAQMQGVSL